MKSMVPMHPAVSLQFVVYSDRSKEAASRPTPFYVWGKHSLSFCKSPQRAAPRGH